jgi:hypothetical protein
MSAALYNLHNALAELIMAYQQLKFTFHTRVRKTCESDTGDELVPTVSLKGGNTHVPPQRVSSIHNPCCRISVVSYEWLDEYRHEWTSSLGCLATVPSGVPHKSHRCAQYMLDEVGMLRGVMGCSYGHRSLGLTNQHTLRLGVLLGHVSEQSDLLLWVCENAYLSAFLTVTRPKYTHQ